MRVISTTGNHNGFPISYDTRWYSEARLPAKRRRNKVKRSYARCGTSNGNCKFSDEQIAAMKQRHSSGMRQTDNAKVSGCSLSYLCSVLSGNKRKSI